MHKDILSDRQLELLPLMAKFRREYYLVGGTAIALYIGHRRSIDFDLFKLARLNHKKNLDRIYTGGYPIMVTRRVEEQMNLIVNGVKVTFFQYPFSIQAEDNFENVFRLPSLLTLAAMKAYALGRRSKWKDYVDLYFLLKGYCSLEKVVGRAGEIFGDLFSEKLFRAQLSYFNDVDYTEEVEYLVEDPPSNEEIKRFLTQVSLSNIV